VKALILAAGYATRLRPLTDTWAKELLPVGGRPLIDWILDAVAKVDDVDAVHVVTNSRKTADFHEWAAARDDDVTIHDDGTSSNDDRLGAIGDIGFVLERLGVDEELVVVAGDNLFGSDVSGLVELGRERDAPVVAVHDVGDLERMHEYNQIEVDAEGRIVFFEEKPERARTTLSGVALYYYPRHALPLIQQYLREENNPDQPGRLVEWLYPRTPFYTWLLPGEWFDIGSAETLAEADRIFSQSRSA
jgi:glucose-1-phosphate thymidylyltransferase